MAKPGRSEIVKWIFLILAILLFAVAVVLFVALKL
jgi:hypothetical protein